MQRKHARTGSLAFILATAFFLAPATAQERCKVDEVLSAKNSTYTEQHAFDVGDIPGHQIRVFELKRTFPDDKPNCEGLKRTEALEHAYSDYYDRNGTLHAYEVITYENGDKIFGVVDGITQTVTAPDGSKKTSFFGVSRFTGGTGKYANVRGLLRSTVVADLEKKLNEAHEGEYWIEK